MKTCEEISTEISNLLNERRYAGQFVVAIVDRCIENWILADWSNVAIRFKQYGVRTAPKGKKFEGKQGKSELKKLLPRDLLYNEPTWGKDMFIACRPERIYQKSASFRAFVDQLKFHCPWLSRLGDRFRPRYK